MLNEVIFYFCRNLFIDLNKIDYVYIKGETTSLMAYDSIGSRKTGDIDLLISRDNIKQAEEILKNNGFSQKLNSSLSKLFNEKFSHQTMPWIKVIGNLVIQIDINVNIFWGEYQGDYSFVKDFISNYHYQNIYNVKIKVLDENLNFILLCLHQYKDMNSIYLLYKRKQYNKNAFYEIQSIIELNKIDFITILNYSLKYKCEKYIAYIINCLVYISTNSKLNIIYDLFKKYIDDELFDSYGLSINERKKWPINFINRYNCNDLFEIIKSDLNRKDITKIRINERIYG